MTQTPAEQASEKKTIKAKVYAVNGRPIIWRCQLYEKRIALNLTLRDVEKGCGVSNAVLSTVERGTDPQLTTACRIAAFFGCSVEEMWPEAVDAGLR